MLKGASGLHVMRHECARVWKCGHGADVRRAQVWRKVPGQCEANELNMNWDAISATAEVIGAGAVVATLVYLAIQIRQNTAALRATSGQDVVGSFRNFNRLLLEVDGLPEVFLTGLREYPAMDQPTRMQFGAFMSDNLLHFQEAFALHESGNLDQATYRAYLDFFAAFLATPGGAAYWSEFQAACPPGMAVEVDARLESGELIDLLSMPFYRVE